PDGSPDVSPDNTEGTEELPIRSPRKKKTVQGREMVAFTWDYSSPDRYPRSQTTVTNCYRRKVLSTTRRALADLEGLLDRWCRWQLHPVFCTRQEVLNSGLVEDIVRGRTTDLDGQLAETRVAHKELEALVLERSGMVEKLRVERADQLDQTKALGDEISRIRSSEEMAVSAALSRMERQRQLDATMVFALRAELGLSCARAGDDKALEQSRYDSELVQTRAAFEAEKREMLLESERNDEKWRTEFLRFKNEVLDASLAIREQARLDGELRASLAQKDKTIPLLERADAEKQTAALEVCPRCEELKLEVLKLTTRVVSQIEEERRLNAVVDARDLQIRILEGEAHESNVNLNMLTDMNGELQSELLSREELRSERNVLEGTAAELVSAQAALAQERVRLDEAKRGFAAKVADERALFDEERRSWLTQLSNDRSKADLERREMNIAMQAERSRLLSERLELLRVPPATPNQPNVVSAVGYETAHPVQQPDYLHDSTLWSRLWLRRWERTPRFVRSRTGPHLPLRVAVAVTGTIRAGLEKAHMVRVDSVGAADPEGMVVMAVEIRLRIHGLVRTHTPYEREDGRNHAEQYPQGEKTVREYAWRINDAAQDLELRHSQAVQIFIDGCKDPGLASCIRGSETRLGTIQECLDYLRFRDMDLDMRLNDANRHDVPRSTSSATRVNRTNSTDATSKSTEVAMAALRADVASDDTTGSRAPASAYPCGRVATKPTKLPQPILIVPSLGFCTCTQIMGAPRLSQHRSLNKDTEAPVSIRADILAPFTDTTVSGTALSLLRWQISRDGWALATLVTVYKSR
ncbi:hypothetical protein DYB26_006479, partial [Aphanomyces astaci]